MFFRAVIASVRLLSSLILICVASLASFLFGVARALLKASFKIDIGEREVEVFKDKGKKDWFSGGGAGASKNGEFVRFPIDGLDMSKYYLGNEAQ